MEIFLMDWGLPALLLVSFLAATILPVASEWLLVALVVQNVDPGAAVGIATLGNTLGAVTTWALGVWGGPYILQRWLRIDARDRRRAERWYGRWGSWSLLMAWAPVVGDPLCFVGGLLKVPLGRFILLVAAGKAARYAALAWAAIGIAV
ncbi:MAG: VTT domain-containing protein [Desulfobacterales bacterium]|jgi:membrane protein YqaA with SNARE-associated domain